MRVYFTSEAPCALRLGGALAGYCARHEQFADLPDGESTLAEFFPEDAALCPAAFLISGNFFRSPPSFCDVYRYSCGASIHVKRFAPRREGLKVLAQMREGSALATLYEDGGIQLCVEDANAFRTVPLPCGVRTAELKRLRACGRTLIAAEGKTADGRLWLALYDGAAPLFAGEVASYEGGDTLKTTRLFRDTAGHTAESVWTADGTELRLEKYDVKEREGFDPEKLDSRIIPFVFFETLLARGNFARYLSPALQPRAAELIQYLGQFTGVCVPPSVFYLTHGSVNAAGLIYPERENLFRIRFFSAPLENGKIANIVPADE